MSRILLWSALAVAALVGVVIALALAPRVAVLVIAAVGILALAIRLALWIRFRGSPEDERDMRGEDVERGDAMQTLQRDKARHAGPSP